ncbi:type II toxin-antitoxin system antitoxin DNA ADP-ribosyl glycohydrolase DarG [Terrihabitans sp. B22-R8]|uniref:type II toxin-antitoxin system antitoxin DNA ADP-ribosyl glycohydrolase DarG n=1 Tax=Terrihabitans sp. B22-R8 TaxID=3425128 RepID=UPI00403CD5AE
MLTFTSGNLLQADADALVNTVNTVGVMGKGIALMFKEAFPENFKAYEQACKTGQVKVGKLFVTESNRLDGPRWIVNFPTKKHWRHPSKIEWIDAGLDELRDFIIQENVKSIALPPLGSGNGGLAWSDVRVRIEDALADLHAVEVIIFEPTAQYQNVTKREGVQKLTPARAMVAELVRRYSVLGLECSLLEVQKLAYFLERSILRQEIDNPLDLQFGANKYGPYSQRLTHLLNGLDGSYLRCGKRLADAGPHDLIVFDDAQRDRIAVYLNTEAKSFHAALECTSDLIDGFESPLGMELLATVDWLHHHEEVDLDPVAIGEALKEWPGGPVAAARKIKIFDDRLIALAVERISSTSMFAD